MPRLEAYESRWAFPAGTRISAHAWRLGSNSRG